MSNFERIPNYTELRQDKDGYDTRYVIDVDHPLHNDPLVDPREPEFGFEDASSYYAKKKLVPGLPDLPLLRLDVARRLVRANEFLMTDPDVREALGSPARIRIDDAIRPLMVQKYAFYEYWPAAIRKENPDLSPEEIMALVPKYCAKPKDEETATPHSTGGAFDAALTDPDGQAFDRGHAGGAVKGTAFPDFHEGYHLVPRESDIPNIEGESVVAEENSVVVLGRRILHYAMTNAKIGGLYVNPNEIWHYGKGDPLSTYVAGETNPYYGIATLPESYVEAIRNLKP